MYSQKLENIPNGKSQELQTYLSRASENENSYVRRRPIAKQTGIDEATVQVILSELTDSGVLVAKLQIRCPYCSTQHGIYARKGGVPNEKKLCFNCENEIQLNRERNWEVVYEVTDEADDFFPSDFTHLLKYSEEGKEESAQFFQHELEKLKDMNNPQRRGRIFDYFVGLLFHQIDGLDVRIQPEGDSGETDVHIVCIDGPDWFSNTCGSHTMIENKWEKDPIQKGPIHKFYGKISSKHSCKRAYFLSMSGFTKGNRSNIGAHTVLKKFQDPEIVDLWEDNLQEMVDDGDPSHVLRQKLVP